VSLCSHPLLYVDVVRLLLAKSPDALNTQESIEGVSRPPACTLPVSHSPAGNTPLSIACWQGHSGLVPLLLENGARLDIPDSVGLLPLHKAALNDHADTIAAALSRDPAAAKLATAQGQSLLSTAAASGSVSTMRLLLSYHADVDQADRWGQTPLLRAAAAGHATACDLLLEHRAAVDAKDGDGTTALLAACAAGHAGVVTVLCERGRANTAATVLATGDTAMHLAARSGDPATVLALITARAPAHVANLQGQYPADVAALSVVNLMPLQQPDAGPARAPVVGSSVA
jgi:ankyrin repeat protein